MRRFGVKGCRGSGYWGNWYLLVLVWLFWEYSVDMLFCLFVRFFYGGLFWRYFNWNFVLWISIEFEFYVGDIWRWFWVDIVL